MFKIAYTKTNWVDRSVQYPSRFTSVTNADGTITLTPSPGTITQSGTPITAAALNNLESQYDDALAWVKSFGLGDVANDISGTNLNNLDATGFYKGSNLANAPTADTFFIENIKIDANNRYQQIYQSTNGNGVWRRFQNAGTWGSWDYVNSTSNFSSLLAANGYQKLPSGLIIQWGVVNNVSLAANTFTNNTISTPITFPSSHVFSAVMVNPNTTWQGLSVGGAKPLNTSTISYAVQNGSTSQTASVYFFCIGW